MSDPRRQKQVLAVLLVILAVSATYRAIELGGDGQVAERRAAAAGRVESVLAEIDVPHLDLELLRREAATYKPGRDPFRFGEAAPPPRPAPPPQQKPPNQRSRRPKPAVAKAPPPVPAGPRPPKIDFVYLGSFGPNERRIAVFIKGDEIYNALAGEVLMESFIVDKIGFESADIRFVGFPDTPGTRLEAGG